MSPHTGKSAVGGSGKAVAGYGGQNISVADAQRSEPDDSNSTSITSETPESQPTTASLSTRATSSGTDGGQEANNQGQPAAHHNPTPIFPPPHPLTHGAGAQFNNQLQPPPTAQQQAADRRTRMRVFHDVFLELGVLLPNRILEQVDDARYGAMATPPTVAAQLAARYNHTDPMTRWTEAEDTWNAETQRMRARWPEMGRLVGWEDLEDL